MALGPPAITPNLDSGSILHLGRNDGDTAVPRTAPPERAEVGGAASANCAIEQAAVVIELDSPD